jgi:antitoxin CptB
MDQSRLDKLRYRAWRRGFREADLILGPFADRHVHELDERQLAAFERLLEAPDHELYGWIVGREPAPTEFDDDVLGLIREFRSSWHSVVSTPGKGG